MFGLMPRRSNDIVTNFFNDSFFNDDFFENSLAGFRSAMNDQFRVDVKEDENAYTIEADLPGVNKEEIGLDYNQGTLYIGVNHQEDVNNQDNKGYIHKERRSVSMQRGIYVGDIDAQGIEAKLENGVLRVTAPKLAISNQQYRIEIQ